VSIVPTAAAARAEKADDRARVPGRARRVDRRRFERGSPSRRRARVARGDGVGRAAACDGRASLSEPFRSSRRRVLRCARKKSLSALVGFEQSVARLLHFDARARRGRALERSAARMTSPETSVAER
jgi:hypothetical protein